mmetsp:Transcript_33890/g.102195  ORF Transcript_33890/g.102195 Transcript_33890/m.102195 type:complete len:218 (+) Transcript_33890:223-876(+)
MVQPSPFHGVSRAAAAGCPPQSTGGHTAPPAVTRRTHTARPGFSAAWTTSRAVPRAAAHVEAQTADRRLAAARTVAVTTWMRVAGRVTKLDRRVSKVAAAAVASTQVAAQHRGYRHTLRNQARPASASMAVSSTSLQIPRRATTCTPTLPTRVLWPLSRHVWQSWETQPHRGLSCQRFKTCPKHSTTRSSVMPPTSLARSPPLTCDPPAEVVTNDAA